ncbi:DUF6030 family protein [Pararhizobium sp. BT-229]|uniref:DUF6030 family protein n=1 Tax=Pararhizobium sp. BT-229 TaxID=2986923 RepID=UPI0021F6FB59|nr:DUF6030 family protein [Pararhizobium sp. BT-229]MCV9966018.1 DUF6030 family protein [Pararhizobium sp. BT-229]
MKRERKSRSGKIFFLVAVGLVFAGILATVLLANGHRNLDLLLTYLGYPDLLARIEPAPQEVKITQSRGVRLPPARMILPVYAFADLKAPEQHFIRLIQSDPRTLCEQLKSGGFGNLDWTVSSANKDNWECSSFVDLPARSAEVTAQSSVFIFIKGDGENRVTSFRVKLNIESAADTIKVADLAGSAANIFLQQVRWGNPGEIIRKIHALEAFDIRNFGSRIQFKREFGETPRYNFLANQVSKPGKKAPGDLFFDRGKWFPLTGSDGLPMIDGMMAGESAEGLMLDPAGEPRP